MSAPDLARDPEAYWNDEAGPRWVAVQPRLDAMLVRITEPLMRAAAAAPGERVIDVGCGCGTTTLELAERIGPGGHALGVDISRPMLEHATARGRGIEQVRFVLADAATHAFEPGATDLALSRFGVMFFADSVAAFRNVARALRPGGRCVFACWRSIEDNPWLTAPMADLGDLLPPPEPPPPDAPGPFRFADRDATHRVLAAAGFGRIEIDPLDVPLTVPGSVDEVLAFSLEVGPLRRTIADLDPATRDRALARIHAALARAHDGTGVTHDSGAWIVSAWTRS